MSLTQLQSLSFSISDTHVTPESPAAPVTQLESPPLSHIIELDFFVVSAQM